MMQSCAKARGFKPIFSDKFVLYNFRLKLCRSQPKSHATPDLFGLSGNYAP